ncbi:MAG: Mur ligase family protein [Candidatus Microthrix parvicella]
MDGLVDHETSTPGIAEGRLRPGGTSVAGSDIADDELESMRQLCGLLGDPQHAAPVILVTGTNGKGTVATLLTRLLMASGLTVGTTTSPDLGSVLQRVMLDDEPLEAEVLSEALEAVQLAAGALEAPPTRFEALIAAAYRSFADAAVEVMVVEVGMLGRSDATNVADAQVAVVTNIGRDHTPGGPGWEQQVAAAKAGIVRRESTVVLGGLDDELAAVIEAEGPERVVRVGHGLEVDGDQLAVGGHQAELRTEWGIHPEVFVPAFGSWVAPNALLAVAAAEAFFDRALDDEVIDEAFAGVRLRGRAEVLARQPLIILDSAHNPEAVMALADTLSTEFDVVGSRMAVVGLLVGRDPRLIAEALVQARLDSVILTSPPSPRAADLADVVAAFTAAGLSVESVVDPETALARAMRHTEEEDLLVVAGSMTLLPLARDVIEAILEVDGRGSGQGPEPEFLEPD